MPCLSENSKRLAVLNETSEANVPRNPVMKSADHMRVVLQNFIAYRDSLIRDKNDGKETVGTNQSIDDLIADAETSIRHFEMLLKSFGQ